jgi:hypothetical protein
MLFRIRFKFRFARLNTLDTLDTLDSLARPTVARSTRHVWFARHDISDSPDMLDMLDSARYVFDSLDTTSTRHVRLARHVLFARHETTDLPDMLDTSLEN